MEIEGKIEQAMELVNRGKYTEAYDQYEEILSTLKGEQQIERIFCLNEMSACLRKSGRIDEAEIAANRALKLAKKEPIDPKGQGNALHHLGFANWAKGGFIAAEDFFHQSLRIRKEIDDSEAIVHSLNALGILYHDLGRIKGAESYYNQAISRAEQNNHQKGLAMALNNLGDLLRSKGDLEAAEALTQRNISLWKRLKNQFYIAINLNVLGAIYRLQGDLRKAEEAVKRSIDLLIEVNTPRYLAGARFALIRILLEKGEIEQTVLKDLYNS